jgi:murein DD-endopeptidase MepM/ murein hydrolase activator NlpD
VILEHPFDAPEGGRVFTLYGHLNTIEVQAGQSVAMGQPIGTVGATGIALGSHLHFEVRLGNPDDYFAVRNPELWLAPLGGTGLLVGRVVNKDGALVGGVRIGIANRSNTFPTYSYADPALRSDPAYNENFAMNDLRVGCYVARVRGTAPVEFCINEGKITLIEIRLP